MTTKLLRGCAPVLLMTALMLGMTPDDADAQGVRIGSVGYQTVSNEAGLIHTRVDWLSGNIGYGNGWFAYGRFGLERDFDHRLTLRVAAMGGINNDARGGGRAPFGMVEGALWLHTHRVHTVATRHVLAANRWASIGVTIPTRAVFLKGVQFGVAAALGRARIVNSPASRFGDAIVPAVFVGYSAAWIRSSLHYIAGVGRVGGGRYRRVYGDIMFAPYRIFVNGARPRSGEGQEVARWLGGRIGVENLMGRPHGMSLRAEFIMLPGAMGAMINVGLGFSSLLVDSR